MNQDIQMRLKLMTFNIKEKFCLVCPYQERHHVAAEGILHPQWKFTVNAKSVKAQN